MKLIHLSDLHLGKRLFGFSLLENQAHILDRILACVDEERPDAVLIAGDLYDKPIPPAEAVQLCDRFLTALSARRVPVLAISGNHDSPERVSFAGQLLRRSGYYVAPVYDGTLEPVTLSDAWGPVDFYLLPFVKPAHLRRLFPDEPIESYTDAMAAALRRAAPDPSARRVLVTHQFVTGAERSESEELSVGGSDNVDAAVFADFDYVALGHLHRPQTIGTRIRYCGSPLQYAFSEGEKSLTVAELGPQGALSLRAVPLTPMRPLRSLRGTYEALTARSFYAGTGYRDAYLHITLTDEDDVPEAIHRLRAIYPYVMQLSYDNRRTRQGAALTDGPDEGDGSPLEIFERFYEARNNRPISETQRGFLTEQIERIWEGET